MPTAPVSIFVPASAGGSPTAPAEVFVPASEGGAPDTPAEVFVPETGSGGIPSTLTITGITDPVDSDPLVLQRGADVNGYPFWNLVDGGNSYEVYHETIYWKISINTLVDYGRQKVSDALTPVGLTSWDRITGDGAPTIAGGPSAPPSIFTPAT